MLKWLKILTGYCHDSNVPLCSPNIAPYSPATVKGFPPSTLRVIASGLARMGKRGMGCNADTFQAPVAKAEISQKPSLMCLTQGGVRRVSRKVDTNAIAVL